MAPEDSHLISDRDATTAWCQWGLRWFWLALLPIVLGTGRSLGIAPALVLAALAVAQILVSAGLLRGISFVARPDLGQVLDALAGLALVLAGEGTTLAWLGLLVAAASAGCRGGAGAALRFSGAVMVLGGAVLGLEQGSLAVGLTQAGLHGLLLIPTGTVLGSVALRLAQEAKSFTPGLNTDVQTLGGGHPALMFEEIEHPTDLLRALRARAVDALTSNGVPDRGLDARLLVQDHDGWFFAGDKEGYLSEKVDVVSEGLIRALESGAVQTSSSSDSHSGLQGFAESQGWSSAACLPLDDGEEQIGALLLGHEEPGMFGQERRRLLGALGREGQLAARYARLYHELQTERDRMTEMQEEARKKLARDLHDGPTQTIAAIAMRTNFARREMDRDLEGAQEELRKVEEMARQTTKEIRHMLFTLRPLILESQGLAVALHQFAQKVRDTHDQEVWVEAEPEDAGRLSGEEQGLLFYIAEEAVTNACKHAAAENVWIRLLAEGDAMTLEVEDDGVGFNVGAVDAHYEQRGSLGMVTMRERAELLDADFEIHSEEGQGTLIRVSLKPGDDGKSPEAKSTADGS
ncbi:MAG: sensor histidine kinase [Anaerolineales bacterium]|nr:sensor histidine kinase [Anaerolineales bacterium]